MQKLASFLAYFFRRSKFSELERYRCCDQMLLKLRSVTGTMYYIECYENETIADVKRILEERHGLSPNFVSLTLNNHTVTDGDIINRLVKNPKSEVLTMSVFTPSSDYSARGLPGQSSQQEEIAKESERQLVQLTEDLRRLGFTDTGNIQTKIIEAGFRKDLAIAELVKENTVSVRMALSTSEKRNVTTLANEFPEITDIDVLTTFLCCGKDKKTTKLSLRQQSHKKQAITTL